MAVFGSLFGRQEQDSTPPPTPPRIEDESQYIAWFIRYSEELKPIRELYKKNLDGFIAACVVGAQKELGKYSDGNSLFERVGDLAVFYESQINPLVEKRGGLKCCPPQLQGAAVSVIINISVISEFLKEKYRHPEATALFNAANL